MIIEARFCRAYSDAEKTPLAVWKLNSNEMAQGAPQAERAKDEEVKGLLL